MEEIIMRVAAAVLLPLLLAACGGGSTITPQQVAEPRAAVRAAETAGADADPSAKAFLTLARRQLGQAEGLMQQGAGEAAAYPLERGRLDAELALAIVRANQAENERVQAVQRLDELRREGQRLQ